MVSQNHQASDHVPFEWLDNLVWGRATSSTMCRILHLEHYGESAEWIL